MIRVKEGLDRRVGGTVSLRFGGERVKFGMFECEGLLPLLAAMLENELLRDNDACLESAACGPALVFGLLGGRILVVFLLLPPNKVL